MKFLVILAALAPVLSWNTEYHGFVHIRNWALKLEGLTDFMMTDGTVPPLQLVKDYCANDPQCGSFGCRNPVCLRKMVFNSTYDVYLAVDASAVAAPIICRFDTAGCGSPTQAWLNCDRDFGNNPLYNPFNLPPDIIHSTCISNPQCIGFRVANDGSRGDLIKDEGSDASGWFALPASALHASKDLLGLHEA